MEVVLLPLLLSNNSYAELEFIKSISLLGPYALLGSFSGYIYNKYTLKSDTYEELFFWGALSGIIGGLIFGFYYNSWIVVFLFFINAISLLQEKKLQVSGNFFLSILFKPFFSFFLLIIIIIHNYSKFDEKNVSVSLLISYLLAYFTWTFLCFKKSGIVLVIYKVSSFNKSIKIYFNLIRNGFLINLSTILLSFYIFNLRIFIKDYSPSHLSSFSLASNFAQFVFLGINTVGYILTVKIGEQIETVNKNFILTVLFKTFLFYLVLVIGGATICLCYNLFVKKFDFIVEYYSLLSLFLGLYYVSSIVSPVLLYRNTINKSTIVLIIIFLIDFTSTKLMALAELNSFLILSKSGFLLILSALYNLYLVLYKSRIRH